MTDKNDGGSFDPKTWIKGEETPVLTPSKTNESPQAADNAEPSISYFSTLTNRRTLLGLGAGSAILCIGGITATIFREQNKNAAKVVTSSQGTSVDAATIDSANSSSSIRTLNLSSLHETEAALLATGIDAESVYNITKKLAQLMVAKGEVRLVMKLDVKPSKTVLLHATFSNPDSSGLEIIRISENNYDAKKIQASLTTRLVVKRGEVDANSFYTSAVSAGITDSLIPGFLKVFTFDFDFQFEIKEGDIFEAGFEELINSQGEVYGEPKLVYASLTTSKKSKSVYFFEQSSKSLDELGGWYDGNGHSIIRSFMRTPLDGARMRISSNFGFRKHPISGFKKLHKGTDFAAPTGTPVYAASDGNVLFASMKGANGNLVIIEHTNGWLTYYLHLNDFGPGIQAGIGVKQGQRIGDVGTTGRSTGPHLHYEIHINGEAIDPLGIEVDEGKKLSELNQQAFFKERDRIDAIRATSNF